MAQHFQIFVGSISEWTQKPYSTLITVGGNPFRRSTVFWRNRQRSESLDSQKSGFRTRLGVGKSAQVAGRSFLVERLYDVCSSLKWVLFTLAVKQRARIRPDKEKKSKQHDTFRESIKSTRSALADIWVEAPGTHGHFAILLNPHVSCRGISCLLFQCTDCVPWRFPPGVYYNVAIEIRSSSFRGVRKVMELSPDSKLRLGEPCFGNVSTRIGHWTCGWHCGNVLLLNIIKSSMSVEKTSRPWVTGCILKLTHRNLAQYFSGPYLPSYYFEWSAGAFWSCELHRRKHFLINLGFNQLENVRWSMTTVQK